MNSRLNNKYLKKILKIENKSIYTLVDDLIYGITKLLYAEGIEGNRVIVDDDLFYEEEKLLEDIGIRKRKNCDNFKKIKSSKDNYAYKFKYKKLSGLDKEIIINRDDNINEWYTRTKNFKSFDKIFKIKLACRVYDYPIFEYNISREILKVKYPTICVQGGINYKTILKIKKVSLNDLKSLRDNLVNIKYYKVNSVFKKFINEKILIFTMFLFVLIMWIAVIIYFIVSLNS